MSQSDMAAPSLAAVSVIASPMELLGRAVSAGASVEVLERLIALHERVEQASARKAFDAAIAAAKAGIKPIYKANAVVYDGKGGRTSYSFESLGDIAEAVDPILAKHGLSYRYRSTQTAGNIAVTCVVAHRDGYSEETTLVAGADATGGKNNIQAIGSTVTYLQRYTLKLALGLAAAKDDDGRGGQEQQPGNGNAVPDLRTRQPMGAPRSGSPAQAVAEIEWLDGRKEHIPYAALFERVMAFLADAEASGELRSAIAFRDQNKAALAKFWRRGDAEKSQALKIRKRIDAIEAAIKAQNEQSASEVPSAPPPAHTVTLNWGNVEQTMPDEDALAVIEALLMRAQKEGDPHEAVTFRNNNHEVIAALFKRNQSAGKKLGKQFLALKAAVEAEQVAA